VRKTYTLKSLKLRCCSINDAGIQHLLPMLEINGSLLLLDIDGNNISQNNYFTALGDVQANNDANALRADAHAVDASELSVYVSAVSVCVIAVCNAMHARNVPIFSHTTMFSLSLCFVQ
jgi:hypothetical protein